MSYSLQIVCLLFLWLNLFLDTLFLCYYKWHYFLNFIMRIHYGYVKHNSFGGVLGLSECNGMSSIILSFLPFQFGFFSLTAEGNRPWGFDLFSSSLGLDL